LLPKEGDIAQSHREDERELWREEAKEVEELFAGHEIGEIAEPIENGSKAQTGGSPVEKGFEGIGAVVDEKEDRFAVLIPERIDQREEQRDPEREEVEAFVRGAVSEEEEGDAAEEGDAEQERFEAEEGNAGSQQQVHTDRSRIHGFKIPQNAHSFQTSYSNSHFRKVLLR